MSPFLRSGQTYQQIRLAFTDEQVRLALLNNVVMAVLNDPHFVIPLQKVVWHREDPRLREQEWGNLQDPQVMKQAMEHRRKVGAFFYRFPTGERWACHSSCNDLTHHLPITSPFPLISLSPLHSLSSPYPLSTPSHLPISSPFHLISPSPLHSLSSPYPLSTPSHLPIPSPFPLSFKCLFIPNFGCSSGADVFDRVSMFLETLYRDMHRGLCGQNTVIVSHGLFCRVFLTRFFRWSVRNPLVLPTHTPNHYMYALNFILKTFLNRLRSFTSFGTLRIVSLQFWSFTLTNITN